MRSKSKGDVARIAADPDALEAFYREHVGAVQSFVARRVADPQLAADLTADIFVAAIGSAKRYRARRGRPIAWLFGIARHVVADELRRQGREARAVRRISGRALVGTDALVRIEERLDAERETRQLYEALTCLPERDRALMELVAVDGLSVTEAAAVLGLKPATARVRLHRCRESLRNHLQSRVEAALTPEVKT
jgi:RNA polymerase sigma-70 factor (ECF subfamily)